MSAPVVAGWLALSFAIAMAGWATCAETLRVQRRHRALLVAALAQAQTDAAQADQLTGDTIDGLLAAIVDLSAQRDDMRRRLALATGRQ